MKIIHCADLHLDSRLSANLDRDRAKQRRGELLQNFARLAQYAQEEGVEAVLIAGDLFDRDTVSALVRNTVLSVIESHPKIRFYYLRGNHDAGDCLRAGGTSAESPAPENLFLFGNRWRSYPEGEEGGIAIAGIDLTRENAALVRSSLRLDPERFNIVLLHGQTGTGPGEIDLRAFRGRGIDYLALGHVHAGGTVRLDGRGICCYPGCLEGRGFDEPGPHGFMLLEINEKIPPGGGGHRLSLSFVPFARRVLHALRVDVAGCRTTAQMKDLVDDALRAAGCRRQDMAEVTLCGELDVECEKDPEFLEAGLRQQFFFARLKDATVPRIDPGEYLYDESLRGEFVRLVMQSGAVPDEDRAAVIRWGFLAMDGEELL